MAKNEKEMSAEELVRQLNAVLDIDDNDDKTDVKTPEEPSATDTPENSDTEKALNKDYLDEIFNETEPEEPKKENRGFFRKLLSKNKNTNKPNTPEITETPETDDDGLDELTDITESVNTEEPINNSTELSDNTVLTENTGEILLLSGDKLKKSETIDHDIDFSFIFDEDDGENDNPDNANPETPETPETKDEDEDKIKIVPDVEENDKTDNVEKNTDSENAEDDYSDDIDMLFVSDVFEEIDKAQKEDNSETIKFPGTNRKNTETSDDAEQNIPDADEKSKDENPDIPEYSDTEESIMDALFSDAEIKDIPSIVDGDKTSREESNSEDDEYLSGVNPVHTEKHKKKAPDYKEFSSPEQRRAFIQDYRKKYRSLSLRRDFSIIFFILLAVYESLPIFGVEYPYFCNHSDNPGVYVMIGLQLYVFCTAFAYKELHTGLRKLFKGGYTESLTVLVCIFSVIYAVGCAVVGVPNGIMFLTPAAFFTVCTLSGKTRELKREVISFKIASSSKPKYVMEAYSPEPDSAEENEFDGYLPENPIMIKVAKTAFVNNFIKENRNGDKSNTFVGIMLPLIFLSVIGMFVAGLFNGGVGTGLNYAYVTALCCTPAATFIASSLPVFICANRAYNHDSTFVSESAVRDYIDASVITFTDEDVYPPDCIKMQKIKLYGDSRVDHVLFVISSLITKLGGSLSKVFAAAATEFGKTDDVTIKSVSDDGIEAIVNSEYILIGSAAFMEEKNFIPVYTREDEVAESNNEKRIMYFAANGTINAKFYFTYVMDSDFISLIKQLAASDRCIAIKTFDPNIDTSLLSADIDVSKYPVKIIKCGIQDKPSVMKPSSNGAIVSKDTPKSLLKTLTMCDRMSNSVKTNRLVCWLCAIIGLMLSVFAEFTGIFGHLNSLYLLAYQVLFIIIIAIITRIHK